MKIENKTQWITQYEVLQMLNISRATLLRWRQKGYLPSYRFHVLLCVVVCGPSCRICNPTHDIIRICNPIITISLKGMRIRNGRCVGFAIRHMILSGFAIRRLFIVLKGMRIRNPYNK